MDRLRQPSADSAKMWAAAERPPEEGYRRKMLRDAAAELQSWDSTGDRPSVHWGAAEIAQGGKIVLWAVAGKLQAAEGWGAIPATAGCSWAPRPLART